MKKLLEGAGAWERKRTGSPRMVQIFIGKRKSLLENIASEVEFAMGECGRPRGMKRVVNHRGSIHWHRCGEKARGSSVKKITYFKKF
jgi:hypothetical protein